jgi:hypothetical protein
MTPRITGMFPRSLALGALVKGACLMMLMQGGVYGLEAEALVSSFESPVAVPGKTQPDGTAVATKKEDQSAELKVVSVGGFNTSIPLRASGMALPWGSGNQYSMADVTGSPSVATMTTNRSHDSTRSHLFVTIYVKHDNKPRQTGWTLKRYLPSGSWLQVGWQRQGSVTRPGYGINYYFVLETGDYRFEITDSGGNGICCEQGNGYYEIYYGFSLGYGSQFMKGSREWIDFEIY